MKPVIAIVAACIVAGILRVVLLWKSQREINRRAFERVCEESQMSPEQRERFRQHLLSMGEEL